MYQLGMLSCACVCVCVCVCVCNMYNNQLFILSLLNYHNSASCFDISTAHHQEVQCIYVANGTFYTS
jgi:hypothetical protein